MNPAMCISIYGPQGAGKSTLLDLLKRVGWDVKIEHDGGEVVVAVVQMPADFNEWSWHEGHR